MVRSAPLFFHMCVGKKPQGPPPSGPPRAPLGKIWPEARPTPGTAQCSAAPGVLNDPEVGTHSGAAATFTVAICGPYVATHRHMWPHVAPTCGQFVLKVMAWRSAHLNPCGVRKELHRQWCELARGGLRGAKRLFEGRRGFEEAAPKTVLFGASGRAVGRAAAGRPPWTTPTQSCPPDMPSEQSPARELPGNWQGTTAGLGTHRVRSARLCAQEGQFHP